jgi:enamine deaminase RidA (YjgF/YER057c/UK114 family)
MRFIRCLLVALLFFALVSGDLGAQKKKPSDEDGMTLPPILPEKKKKNADLTQILPLPPGLPAAVVAETDRLVFETLPLSSKGLLSQQTRDAMKVLLRSNRPTAVKLRAFVAGSGDLRRIGEIVGETFSEKHLALPALSVVQVGGLPVEGAQLALEITALDRRSVNPNGVAFISGQPGRNVNESIERLTSALRAGGMEPSDMLRVTCFVSSLDEHRDTGRLLASSFPNAAIDYVQMQRELATPASECEAVARLRVSGAGTVRYLNPPELEKSERYSQMALVTGPKVVITGAQLAFGNQESDVKLAFERLQKSLAPLNTTLNGAVMAHFYLTSRAMTEKVRAARAGFYNQATPPASTLLPFEGLPSLDASVAFDIIAVPEGATSRAGR